MNIKFEKTNDLQEFGIISQYTTNVKITLTGEEFAVLKKMLRQEKINTPDEQKIESELKNFITLP